MVAPPVAQITRLVCTSHADTVAAGVRLAGLLQRRLAARRGAVIALQGTLGAGKTTFAKGLVHGLGITEAVTSPSYQLVLEYEGAEAGGGPVTCYHIDLYRVDSAAELESLALDDFIHGPGVALVEWAERAGDTLPEEAIRVRIDIADDLSRRVEITDPGWEQA